MRRRSVVIVLYALLMTLGSYLLYTYHCQKKKAKAASKKFTTIAYDQPQDYEQTNPTIMLQGLHLESDSSQENKLQWSLKSKQCLMYHGLEKIIGNDVYCNVTYQGVKGYLYGPKAVFDLKSKNLFLSGNITGHTNEITISGQDIYYFPNLDRLETNKPITLAHNSFTLSAQKTVVFFGRGKRIELSGVKTTIFSVPEKLQAS